MEQLQSLSMEQLQSLSMEQVLEHVRSLVVQYPVIANSGQYLEMNLIDDEEPYDHTIIADKSLRVLSNLFARGIKVTIGFVGQFTIINREMGLRIIGFDQNIPVLIATKDSISLIETTAKGEELVQLLGIDKESYCDWVDLPESDV